MDSTRRPEEFIDDESTVDVESVSNEVVVELQARLARLVAPIVFVLDESHAQVALGAALGEYCLIDGAPRFGLRETQFMAQEFIELLRHSLQAKARMLLKNFVILVESM
jgi:hypothetical protein